jgi:hypothetical protein
VQGGATHRRTRWPRTAGSAPAPQAWSWRSCAVRSSCGLAPGRECCHDCLQHIAPEEQSTPILQEPIIRDPARRNDKGTS